MADSYCRECKMNTVVVFDHSAGDTVCTDCGLVLESHGIDEFSEWRNFAADNDSDRSDPNRVGSPVDPLLEDGGLGTRISGNMPSSFLFPSQKLGPDPNRTLQLAFDSIATMCDRLSLVATIKYRANEIYKNVKVHKQNRGRKQDAVSAACVYIACLQEEKPRTLKEICSVANGVTKKEFYGAKQYVEKYLQLEKGPLAELGATHAGDYMRRFCSTLGMTNRKVKAAQEAVRKSDEFDIRRTPLSVAAAIIYIVNQLSDDKKPLKDVAVATGVAEGTIRNAYKDLYPCLVKIIPSWYAQEEALKNIRCH